MFVAVGNAPFVEGVVGVGVGVGADGGALNVLSQNFFASSRLGAPSPVDASVDAGVIVPNRTELNRTDRRCASSVVRGFVASNTEDWINEF